MTIVVIGGGSIGQRHARNLRSLGVDVRIADPNTERKPDYSSLDAALAAEKFDAAFVCSPSRYHMEQAMRCVEVGCNLFVEKPLSHTTQGLKKLTKLTQRKKLITMVGSNWKFYPLFQKMKELLDAGAIGKLLSARCQFGFYLPDWHPWEDYRKGYSANKKLGGGILLDSHEFDYLPWFVGAKVSELACMTDNVSDLDIDVEDTAEVILRFENGVIGEMHVDYIQRFYQRTFEFLGSEGTILWDTNWKKVVLKSKKEGEKEFPLEEGYDMNTMYLEEAKHFLDCVKNDKETITPIEKGAEVLRLIMAAKESSKKRRLVSISWPGVRLKR